MITTIRLLLISSVTSHSYLFLLLWDQLRSTLLAASKYTIQYCQLQSLCYTLDPQNLLYLEICILWPSFPHVPQSPVPGNHNSTFCFWVQFFFKSTYTWCHILFICIWLISVSTVPSGLSQMAGFPSLFWLNIISLYILFISHFLYFFINQWTFRMFPSCVFNAAVNLGLQISLQK